MHSKISRRSALTGLAATAAAATTIDLSSGLITPAAAKAPMLGASAPSVYRFKLGNFELTTIADGAVQLKGPHPIFGQDQFEEDVQKLATDNFLPPSMMEIAFTPLLVNTGNELVLFDTGNGDIGRRPKAGNLVENLKAAGVSADQVDVVVITHMHPDHIGGITEGDALAFPNARYVTGETEYNFWSAKDKADGRVGKLVQSKVVPQAGKMTFIKPGADVVSGITSVNAFGHTPGHMAYNIESNGKRLLLWADACNHFVASLQRPDWHVRFDMDKDAAAATRKKLLDMAATERVPVTGYHMPFPAIGFIEKTDASYRWTPVAYQMQL